MSTSSWQFEHRLSCHLTSSRTCFSLWSFIHSFDTCICTWKIYHWWTQPGAVLPFRQLLFFSSVSSVEAPARWCSNMLHVLFLRSFVKANKLFAIIWCLFLMFNSVAGYLDRMGRYVHKRIFRMRQQFCRQLAALKSQSHKSCREVYVAKSKFSQSGKSLNE